SSWVAVAMSPAVSAARMREEETRSSPSSSRSSTSTAKPRAAPAALRNSGVPRRWWPKWKSAPTVTPVTASSLTRKRETKSSAASWLNSRLNGWMTMPSRPRAAAMRVLASSVVRRNMKGAGAKTSRGCGSKVSITAGTPAACARSRSRRSTNWWPRWSPSKLPMATIAPLMLSGMPSSPQTRRNPLTCRPASCAGYLGAMPLPRKARHEAGEIGAAGGDEGADGGGIGLAEGVELLGVDGAGDEQQVDVEARRADGVGAHGIADGEHPPPVERAAGGPFGEPQGFPVDRAIGLAGHEDAAAPCLVEIGEGAAAIDEPVAVLDHAVGIGADHRQIAREPERDALLVHVGGVVVGIEVGDDHRIGRIRGADGEIEPLEQRLVLA